MVAKRGYEEPVVDLEIILSQELAGVSWYQARVVLICFITMMFSSLSTNEFVFTTARTDCRCMIPECEGSEAEEFTPPWLNYTIPSFDGEFESCQRFVNTSAVDPSNISTRDSTANMSAIDSKIRTSNGSPEDGFTNDICDITFFAQDIIVQCEQHVYASPKSAVKDYDLCCSEWLRSLLGSARTVGSVLSLTLAGTVSDRFGRRTALTIICFITAVIGLARFAFVTSYIGHIISVFAEDLFGAGAIGMSTYILGVEMVSTENRPLTSNLLMAASSIGQVPLALLAWATPTWRILTLVIYAPQLLSLTFPWILPESVRWTLSKRRYKEVEELLNKIAKSSGRELSEKTSTAFRKAEEVESKTKTDKKVKRLESQVWTVEEFKEKTGEHVKQEPWLLVLVFRHKPILLRCIVVPVWWATVVLVYYGLSINSTQISGNIYLNYIVVALIDIPGQITAYFFMKRAGRKTVLITFYWICSLCQVAYIFLPAGMYVFSMVVYLVGKMAIAGVLAVLYVYTSELFPTPYRHRLVGFCSMLGRVGSIVAPLTPALGVMVWVSLPFVIFAAFAFLSGLLVLLCPETRCYPLPDTMEQASNMGRRTGQQIH